MRWYMFRPFIWLADCGLWLRRKQIDDIFSDAGATSMRD